MSHIRRAAETPKASKRKAAELDAEIAKSRTAVLRELGKKTMEIHSKANDAIAALSDFHIYLETELNKPASLLVHERMLRAQLSAVNAALDKLEFA
mgnify:CR=1 FL=1